MPQNEVQYVLKKIESNNTKVLGLWWLWLKNFNPYVTAKVSYEIFFLMNQGLIYVLYVNKDKGTKKLSIRKKMGRNRMQ